MTESNTVAALARFDKLSPAAQKQTYGALQSVALKRCITDGLFFLQFVKTRDEVDPDETVKPFPAELAYIKALWQEFEQNQKVIIAKSRQMMVSWIVCAFAVWYARRKPNQYIVIQTQNWEDAVKLVCVAGGNRDAAYLGRCQFLERNLPSWLQVRVRENEGQLSYPDNGSVIEALPGGSDKIRGKVPSLVILDEFAMMDEARGVWTAIAPLVQKAMKIVIVSTPNGAGGNCFHSLYHGVPLTAPQSH